MTKIGALDNNICHAFRKKKCLSNTCIGGDTDITVIVGVPIGVIGLITVTAVIVILNIMAVVIYYIHKKRKHTVVLRTLSIVADNTENAKVRYG